MSRRSAAAAAVLGLSLVAPLVGTVPPAAAVGPGETCVQLVISPGALGGSTDASCVTVKDGANGLDVLRAGGHTLRFDDSGLVCAIDGRPATGCGDASSGGYAYWSYWSRTDDGGWRYASRGPGAHPISKTGKQAEGWAWNDGSGSQQGARPAVVPYAKTCPPEQPAGGAVTAPPAPTKALTAAPTKAPAKAPPAPPVAPPPNRPAPSLPGAVPPIAPASGSTAGPAAGVSVTPLAPTTTPSAMPAPSTSAPSTPAPSTSAPSVSASAGDAADGTTSRTVPVAQIQQDLPGGVSPVVTALGVAVGAALLVVAALVARRRRPGGSDIGTPGSP